MAPPPRAAEQPVGPICEWRYWVPRGMCPGSRLRSPGSRGCSHRGQTRLVRHLAAIDLTSLPAAGRKQWPQHPPPGNGAKEAARPQPTPPTLGFLFQQHAEPVLPWGSSTGCSFGLGFASSSFLRDWNPFVILVYAQMPPPQRPSLTTDLNPTVPRETNITAFCTALVTAIRFWGLPNISPTVFWAI